MKQYNYYTVFPYLAHLLGLSGVEKDIFFSILYFLTYTEDGIYYYNIEQLTYNAVCSEKQAKRTLKSLVEKGILNKQVERQGIKKIVTYTLSEITKNLSRNQKFTDTENEPETHRDILSPPQGHFDPNARSFCPPIYKDKNNYNKNNYSHTPRAREGEQQAAEQSYYAELSNSQIKKEQILMALHLPPEHFAPLLTQFHQLNLAKDNHHDSLQDYTAHFIDWLKYQNHDTNATPSNTSRFQRVRQTTIETLRNIHTDTDLTQPHNAYPTQEEDEIYF